MNLKNIVAAAILIGLVVWGVLDYKGKQGASEVNEVQAANGEQNIGVKVGNIAPDFQLENVSKDSFIKLSDYKGKKVILNFWASWCGPCRDEMPIMEKYYNDNKNKDVVLLGVNLTKTERRPENIGKFIEEFELTFPNVLDPELKVADLYRVMAYPTTFIIDTQGVIRQIYYGPVEYNMLKKAISQID